MEDKAQKLVLEMKKQIYRTVLSLSIWKHPAGIDLEEGGTGCKTNLHKVSTVHGQVEW